MKKLPIIIFENSIKDKIEEFTNTLEDANTIVIYVNSVNYANSVNYGHGNFLKEYLYELEKKPNANLTIIKYRFTSMMLGFLSTKEICDNWYAVHTTRFTEKDLTDSYSDVKTNGGTFIPNVNESIENYAKRVSFEIKMKSINNKIQNIINEGHRFFYESYAEYIDRNEFHHKLLNNLPQDMSFNTIDNLLKLLLSIYKDMDTNNEYISLDLALTIYNNRKLEYLKIKSVLVKNL